jgi:exodeoxyribonuclease VII small subunit
MSREKTEGGAFEENFRKLESLSEELQQNKVSIDELVPRMKEALHAVKICKEVLKQTDAQLKEINEAFGELEDFASGEE